MFNVKKNCAFAWLAVAAITGMFLSDSAVNAAGISGEAEFKEHCAACHADGGNIIKVDKTLSRRDREKHGIRTAMDIVKLMRKPGEGMTTFDRKTISDKEAKAIAEYIIMTFK
jgi:cytochrome c6